MKHLLALLAALALTTPALADPSGAVTPGTAGTQSYLMGCYYASSPGSAASGQQRAVGCDVNGNVLTTPAAASEAAPSTDASSTVTSGGTYQTVFASNTSRKGCSIQNPTTATEVLNVRTKSTIVWTVPAGSVFNCSIGGIPGSISDLVEVTAATMGHAFTAASQ